MKSDTLPFDRKIQTEAALIILKQTTAFRIHHFTIETQPDGSHYIFSLDSDGNKSDLFSPIEEIGYLRGLGVDIYMTMRDGLPCAILG